MKRTILLYALALSLLAAVLKFLEYHFLIRDLSIEFYLSVVALLFTCLGVWAGLKLTRRRPAAQDHPFISDQTTLVKLGISKREFEVLELISKGHSNREIADKLFVSLNTIKTHSSNLFIKLDVKRRTQAIQKARKLNLIP